MARLDAYTDQTGFVPVQIRRLAGLSRVIFPDQYGLKGDNVNDDSNALNASIAAATALGGGSVILPPGATIFTGTTRLDCASNVTLVGDATTIRHNGQAFRANALTNGGFRGVTFNGSGAASGQNLIQSCTGFKVESCAFIGQAASVVLTGTSNQCVFDDCSFTSGRSTALELNGASVTQNRVSNCTFTSNIGFGIFLTSATNRNVIENNETLVNGIELVGMTYLCWGNRVIDNHAEGTGDNGISISGIYNVVNGNVVRRCAFHGISLYGSFNSCVGNTLVANGQAAASTYGGIAIPPGFGGLAQLNTVSGNVIDDDQASPTQLGIKINGNSYTAWASGVSISIGLFRYNGLNLYVAATAGTTGATAPTHTSGSVSDGGVTWTFIQTAVQLLEPVGNALSGNTVNRFATSALVDNTTAHGNLFDGSYRFSATPEGTITAPVGSQAINTAGGASTTLYVKTSGTGNTGWTAK